MSAIITPTGAGIRVSFSCQPKESDAPTFCDDHPLVADDQCKAALTFDDPIGSVLGRLWKVNGKTYSMKPTHQPEDDEAEAT